VFQNPHHAAKIDVLTLGEAGDPLIAVRTLVNGGVQGIINVAPAHRPDVAASDDLGLKSYDLRSWWFVAVNTNKGALADKRVRQALDLTIDRDQLKELTIGVSPDAEQSPCELISGPFVGSSPYYNRNVKPRPKSDLAKAAELMTAAGAVQNAGRWMWKGQPITLKVGMNAALDNEAKDLLNQIGNQLQAGGFDRIVYEVSTDEWATKVVTGKDTDYDLLIGKWAFGQVENVNPLFHTRKDGLGAYNVFNYSNADVDAILAKFDGAKTDTEARDAYHALHDRLADDLPYLFLWKLDTKSAWTNQVRNNTISPYYYFTEFDGWTYSTTPKPGGD
jgi:peptide/nickel transport system substrate-binding protein